jgi:hypothetical protein
VGPRRKRKRTESKRPVLIEEQLDVLDCTLFSKSLGCLAKEFVFEER